MDGAVRVGFTYIKPVKTSSSIDMGSMYRENMPMENMAMNFHHSRILKITAPEFDTGAGHKTIKFVLSLLNPSDEVVGNCVVDITGKYIAHANMIMKNRGFLGGTFNPVEVSTLNEMKKRPFGTVESKGHPPETVAGFYKLKNIPWTIIMFAQGDKILKPIILYRNYFAFGGVALLIVILVLILFQAGKIVKRIETLSEKAKKIAEEEYGGPIKVETQDEIGQLVQNYNAMVKELKERDFIRDSFGRYVDPEFAKFLLEHPGAGKLGGKRRQVAIMMSDIRGFTALSETLSPEVIITVLNQYFSQMINIIQKHKGIIVGFFGDSILVFFGPFSGSLTDTIKDCIQCAKDM